VILPDGRPLAQSNAIILHLAEGSDLIPRDPYRVWEQYSHEPYVAVARFQVRYLGRPADALEPRLIERGHAALKRLDQAVAGGGFLVGDQVSLADVSLVACTRWSHEGGLNRGAYPAAQAWIDRVERSLAIT
jgi:glutathione S-transferase